MVPSRMFRSPLWFDVFLCFSCTLAVFGSPAMTSESEIPTPCDSSPCLNGGSCRDDWGFVECSGCDEGWQGNYCEQEIISPCANWTCHNGGSCYLRSWGTAYCDCQTAWQGDHCEQVIPQCVDWICLNGGTCNKDIWDGPICDCDLGWYGEHCDEWRGTSSKACRGLDPCQNGGICQSYNAGEDPICDCPPESTGTYCEQTSAGYAGLGLFAIIPITLAGLVLGGLSLALFFWKVNRLYKKTTPLLARSVSVHTLII